jgi:hypothetical protein
MSVSPDSPHIRRSFSMKLYSPLELDTTEGAERDVAVPDPPADAAPQPPLCIICHEISDLVLPCCGDFICSVCISKQILARSIDRYGGKRCALCRRELSASWMSSVLARASLMRTKALQQRQAIISSLLMTDSHYDGGRGYCDLCRVQVASHALHRETRDHLRSVARAAKKMD